MESRIMVLLTRNEALIASTKKSEQNSIIATTELLTKNEEIETLKKLFEQQYIY